MNAMELVSDPGHLAYGFDFATERVAFLPVELEEISQVSCLKRDFIDPGRPLVDVPLADLVSLLDTPDSALEDNPPRFVFHTAYCASTFLSRCLAVDGVTVSLREPQVLLDAANAKRLQWHSKSTRLTWHDLPKLFLLLLRKHALPSEKLIIKPINSVNNIVPELMQLIGKGKSLMLFTDARNFILSTLKKGEGGKQTVRSMFDLLRCDFPHLSNLQLTQALHMTDLRVTMTLWRLQLEQAKSMLQQYGQDQRMVSLYGEELIRNPLQVLQAANRFLGLDISRHQIDLIANSDDRFLDAKNPGKRFSVQERDKGYERLESFYGNDLDDGLQWLVRNNPGTHLIPRPGPALAI